MSPWIPAAVSAIHVLGLGVGLGAVVVRGRAMRGPVDVPTLLAADNAWGIASILWIGSGVARAFGGLEKGADYYLGNSMFHVKMGLFLLAVLLELWPMVTFLRWRIAMAKGGQPDLTYVPIFRWINAAEVVIICLIPFAAAAMARGIGM